MTILFEGKQSIFMGTQLKMFENARDMASANDWAGKYITDNPAYAWILGNYAEADNPNYNKQFWSFDNLRLGQPSISNSPMNMLHRPRAVVGSFVATEMIYPTGAQTDGAAGTINNPFIEALGVFWRAYFPKEYEAVKEAHDSGSAYLSMECVSNTLTCGGPDGCNQTFEYFGMTHASYCEHLNDGASWRMFNEPHFLGGALIVPPVEPGWGNADVKSISKFLEHHADIAENMYQEIKEDAPQLDPKDWEDTMIALIAHSKLNHYNHSV